MTFDTEHARTWARTESAMGTTRDLLLAACNQIDQFKSALVTLRDSYAGTDQTTEQAVAWIRADAVLPKDAG